MNNMMLFSMAVKNILRSKRRTFRTIAILSMGVVIFVFYGTLMSGFNNISLEETIKEDTAHIQIRNKDFDEDFPYATDNMFRFDATKLNAVEGISYTPTIRLNGEVDNYEDTMSLITFGIDPITANDVFEIKTTAQKSLGDMAWLGSSLAQDMNLSVGDYINITFRTNEGAFISAEYEIGGLLNSANFLFSKNGVMIDLTELQSMLNTDSITYVNIKVEDDNQIENIKNNIKDSYPSLSVLGLDELTKDLQALNSTKNAFMYPFYGIIALITFLGLANSILISVWEKRKTMGTLRSLGFYDNEIVRIFIYEGFCIGLIGAIIGVLLGVLINIPMASVGLDFASLAATGSGDFVFDADFYVPPVMKSSWDPVFFLGPLIVIPFASVFISYFPARKSIKMSIVDCIQNKD